MTTRIDIPADLQASPNSKAPEPTAPAISSSTKNGSTSALAESIASTESGTSTVDKQADAIAVMSPADNRPSSIFSAARRAAS